MKSLLYQTGATPLSEPSECAALPCRSEVRLNLRKDNRVYRIVLRDKVVPEDPYLVLVRATAFAVKVGEPFNGDPTGRTIKDFLIKSSVVI